MADEITKYDIAGYAAHRFKAFSADIKSALTAHEGNELRRALLVIVGQMEESAEEFTANADADPQQSEPQPARKSLDDWSADLNAQIGEASVLVSDDERLELFTRVRRALDLWETDPVLRN
jgi:hypothetical protein